MRIPQMLRSRTLFVQILIVFLVAAFAVVLWRASSSGMLYEAGSTHTPPETPDVSLAPHTVELPDGSEAVLRVAEPFKIAVAAEGLGKARFMAMSPDERMFVPDLVNYNLSHEGKVFILDDWNEETKRFETTHTYLSGLRGPNSVAFYTDEAGNHWLYVALTEHLLRYPYQEGDTSPSGEPEVVTTFPNSQAPGETSVVWHITRTLHFEDGLLYIAIGSGCNACEQPEGEMRGLIRVMEPDGSNERVYADGLRNAVGLEWAEGSLYATANGVDHLGADRPDETLYRIEEGVHYGWPYCYESNGELHPDDTFLWEDAFPCTDAPRSFVAFEPRSAPLGIAYFTNARPELDRTFLVSLHGSFDPLVRRGYEIVRVRKDGTRETFMDGFQSEDAEQLVRPVDILQHDENSFFFTDDHGGRVYYVYADEA